MIAVFFDLCQTRNLSLTARRLGKSKSQVSTLLRQLETITDLTLVNRKGRFYLNERGLSLGKSLYALINLTGFAEQVNIAYLRTGKAPTVGYIRVKIPIRFFGGGMSQALIRSVAICRRLQPTVFIYCEFFDNYNYYHYDQTFWSPDWPSWGELTVNYNTEPSVDSKGYLSPWCLLYENEHRQAAIDNLETLSAYQLVIPKMPWEMMQQMVNFLDSHRIPFVYHDVDYTQLLAQKLPADTVLLVNRLLLTTGLCRGHQVSPFPADLSVGFQIRQKGNHPVLSLFRSVFLRMVQKNAHYFPIWHSRHTWRQWDYLYQVMASGSFVAASKKLFISQPAVSKQIHQMEQAVGTKLIRRHMGKRTLTTTAIGRLYLDIAEGIHVASDDLLRQIATQASYQRQDLNLGILPSVDENSHLLDLVMNKVSRWQKQFPELRINIVEERHQHLLSLLHNQEINLAITEANSPSLTQYSISRPEALGLVIHPKFFQSAAIPTALTWQSAVTDYPLILLRKSTGIRSIIDWQCSQLDIDLPVVLESDSLNLNQRWVKSGAYATILPRSAMGGIIERGEAVFIPLTPIVSRVLKISYLKSRRLNPFEQSLLKSLRDDGLDESVKRAL